MAPSPATQTDSLGRLRDFGIDLPWRAAFLLPTRWDDFSFPLVSLADIESGSNVVVVCRVCTRPAVSFSQKPPRTVVRTALESGEIVCAMFFGDVQKTVGTLKPGDRIMLAGEASLFGDTWWVRNPKLASERWIGRMRPVYPGKPGRMGAELVRQRILRLLPDAIPDAAAWIDERLQGGSAELLKRIDSPVPDLASLLQMAHLPDSSMDGERAQATLETVAAAEVLTALQEHRDQSVALATPWQLPTLRARARQIPFTLSPDQVQAIKALADAVRGPSSSHTVLSGEVASGKTATYGVIAAALADELIATTNPGAVAILLPNQMLAAQIHAGFRAWWPDIRMSLVTGDTQEDPTARVFIGTTALLNRPLPPMVLVVVDEQHKLSTQQRDQLRHAETHFIEVSATCIPRTLALVQHGAVNLVQLRNGHAKRNITTTLWEHTEGRAVYAGVRQTLADGDRVLVLYPAIESGESGMFQTSILDSMMRWEAQLPGQVRALHSRLPADVQARALADVVDGHATVLVSSTKIEVGVNIPRLRRVVVVYPDRFSANVLHQIRGRLAREGGNGHFDMLPMGALQDETRERLQILVKHADGFSVAEADLAQRGFGDLRVDGQRQSGLDSGFLLGRAVKPAHLDALLEIEMK